MSSGGRRDGQRPGGVCKPYWEILELDHPDHLECYYCQKLHSESEVFTRSNIKCKKLNHKLRTAEFIHPDFDLTAFRLVMKQHRQGNVHKNLLKLLSYREKPFIEGSQVKRISAEPRIVSDRLLMHTQTLYVVPPTRGPSQIYLLDRNLLKCPHSSRWSANNITITDRLNRRFATLETVPIGRREWIGSFCCDYCPTEFDISLERFEGQGVLLFINKWQDIGNGLSPLQDGYPPVLGHRHGLSSIRKLRAGKKLNYESPRARFNGASLAEVAHTVLTYGDRWELFEVDRSRRVKFLRKKDRSLWPLLGYGQPYPHNYASSAGRTRDTGESAAITENIASH